jgi:hypothetical protein
MRLPARYSRPFLPVPGVWVGASRVNPILDFAASPAGPGECRKWLNDKALRLFEVEIAVGKTEHSRKLLTANEPRNFAGFAI